MQERGKYAHDDISCSKKVFISWRELHYEGS